MRKNHSNENTIFQGVSSDFAGYYARLLGEMILNLCTPERDDISLLLNLSPIKTLYQLSSTEKGRWESLFEHQPQHMAFTYSSPIAAQNFLKIMNNSGFKLYNIFETFCEVRFHEKSPIKENSIYENSSMLAGVEKIKNKKKNLIIVKFHSVDSIGEQKQMEIEDNFLITVKSDIQDLPDRTKSINDGVIKNLKAHEKITLDIKPNFAWEFGKISGDINFIHATELSKLFGFKKPIVQARCALNLVIAKMDKCINKMLKSINIKMIQKIHTGESYDLEICENAYRIQNGADILAHGNFELA